MENKVVVAQMKTRSKSVVPPPAGRDRRKKQHKRLSGHMRLFAVAFFCLLGCGYSVATQNHAAQTVNAHLTSGFEYDETLGRLQFVSSILPESAMVFLDSSSKEPASLPVDGEVIHAWNEQEPWLEYGNAGSIRACMSGEVMTVVKNREDEYTVRLLHEGGYESLYSGLAACHVAQSDLVYSGQAIGEATGYVAFELRCDGMSVMPVFSGKQ